jgi:hypothetical protein
MAKSKKELLEEAKALGVEIKPTSTIAQIQDAIKAHGTVTSEVAPIEEPKADSSAVEEEPNLAKAGKRSAKALDEAAEKQAKEERKASGESEEAKPKAPVKPTRSRLERRGKYFRKSSELIEKDKFYKLEEAIGFGSKNQPCEVRRDS